MAYDTAWPLIELENDIEEAHGWVRQAVDGIEGLWSDEEPQEAEKVAEAMFRHYPGLRELYDKLKAVAADLADPFTPEMKERLKKEREQYDDEADRWEAQVYR